MRRSAPPSSRWVAAAVPQAMRPHVGCAVDRGDGLMHHRAGLAHIEPPTPGAQQQRRPGLRGDQRRAPVGQPGAQRLGGRFPERGAALLVALTQYAQQPVSGVDVVDVQAAQLADPDAGRIQQLDDQPVP